MILVSLFDKRAGRNSPCRSPTTDYPEKRHLSYLGSGTIVQVEPQDQVQSNFDKLNQALFSKENH